MWGEGGGLADLKLLFGCEASLWLLAPRHHADGAAGVWSANPRDAGHRLTMLQSALAMASPRPLRQPPEVQQSGLRERNSRATAILFNDCTRSPSLFNCSCIAGFCMTCHCQTRGFARLLPYAPLSAQQSHIVRHYRPA